MPIHACHEGTLLIANAAEALRRQCELPARTATVIEVALEIHTEEAVNAAIRHVTDHMMHCPICRTD
jgi:hypothetical protein